MRRGLRRYRWWLLLALAVGAAMVPLVRTALTPDPLQLAFDRVENGMAPDQVEDVMTGYVSKSVMRVDPTFRYNGVDYRFHSGVIVVGFDGRGRVDEKMFHRWHESLWDKLRALLN